MRSSSAVRGLDASTGSPPTPPPQEEVPGGAPTRATRWLLIGVLLIGAALRLGYAAGATGIFHADDLHQTLEPAHGVVYGYGLRAWEFQRGARPWTAPGVYVVLLGLLRVLGITSPDGYMLIVRLFDALLSSLWPLFCYRIGRALCSPRAGLLAAWVAATWYVLVLLAPRALANNLSITFVLWAAAHALTPGEPTTRRRHAALTGVLLGVAFAFRSQEFPACLGLLLYYAAVGRTRELPSVIAGAAVPLAGLGLLDFVTWGVPFHSVLEYVRSTQIEGLAGEFEHMPWYFLFGRLALLTGAGTVLLLALPFAPQRARRFAVTVAGTVLTVHALIPHKEVRYVLAGVVVLLCVSACGLTVLLERLAGHLRRRLTVAVVATVLLAWSGASASRAAGVTYVDFGLLPGLPEAQASPWTFRRDLNRALSRVGTRPDLCGLTVFPYGLYVGHERLVSTGGYTYLHREVPLEIGSPPRESRPYVNYIIACADEEGFRLKPPDSEEVETVGRCVVWRRSGPFTCDRAALARIATRWKWTRAAKRAP